MAVEEADSFATSREPENHIGYVYLVRHTRSWDNEVYVYVGETALSVDSRLDLHYNTAFSQKSQKLGLRVDGLHHAMMKEYQVDVNGYRSCFTIHAIRTTKGPQERKGAEVEEVAKLKECNSKNYNLADGGGNRPPHLRHGQPITLTIGDQAFHYPSKTALWVALDRAGCPAHTKSLRNGNTAMTKARSRWLLAEQSGGSIPQMIGLESLSSFVSPKSQASKDRAPSPDNIWQRFHQGSQRTQRGDLRDELERRAKEVGIAEELLEKRVLYVRYAAGVSTLEEAWKLLLNAQPSPAKIEITLPHSVLESRTLSEWGKFIEHKYSGPKVHKFRAKDIQIRLRNALKHPETLTNDRKLHALGLKNIPRSRRTKREVFNTKGPIPRNYVKAEFTNPLTGATESFATTTKLCERYEVDPVVYYTRLKSGWQQAEALYVVKRKPPPRSRKTYREAYATWLSKLSKSELEALKKDGYL